MTSFLKSKKAQFVQAGLLGIVRLALTTPLGWVILGLILLIIFGLPIAGGLLILFNIKNIAIFMGIMFGLSLLFRRK